MNFVKMSLYRILIIIISLFSFETITSQNLDIHKWKNRILIIQTTSRQSEKYKLQNDLFKNLDDAFKDRKLAIYRIIGNQYKINDYLNEHMNTEWKTINKKQNPNLHATDAFQIILIGLDGSVKLSKTDVLSKEDLFHIIDAMPMRRAELNRNKN